MNRIAESFYIPVFLLFLFSVCNTDAQEIKVLKGKIVSDSITALSGINIINLTNEKGTSSLENGYFEIPARVGDSIYFSSLQFENKTIVVKTEDFRENFTVTLYEKFNELDEVRLDDIKLSGVLSEDIERMPKSVYDKYGFSYPTKPTPIEERKLYFVSGSGGVDVVSMIVYSLNGKKKMFQKVVENSKLSAQVYEAYAFLPTEYYIDNLALPEDEIVNFLYYCMEFPGFKRIVVNRDKLKFIDFLKDKIDDFKELREIEKNEEFQKE